MPRRMMPPEGAPLTASSRKAGAIEGDFLLDMAALRTPSQPDDRHYGFSPATSSAAPSLRYDTGLTLSRDRPSRPSALTYHLRQGETLGPVQDDHFGAAGDVLRENRGSLRGNQARTGTAAPRPAAVGYGNAESSEPSSGLLVSDRVRDRAFDFADQLYASQPELAGPAVRDVLMQLAVERGARLRSRRTNRATAFPLGMQQGVQRRPQPASRAPSTLRTFRSDAEPPSMLHIARRYAELASSLNMVDTIESGGVEEGEEGEGEADSQAVDDAVESFGAVDAEYEDEDYSCLPSPAELAHDGEYFAPEQVRSNAEDHYEAISNETEGELAADHLDSTLDEIEAGLAAVGIDEADGFINASEFVGTTAALPKPMAPHYFPLPVAPQSPVAPKSPPPMLADMTPSGAYASMLSVLTDSHPTVGDIAARPYPAIAGSESGGAVSFAGLPPSPLPPQRETGTERKPPKLDKQRSSSSSVMRRVKSTFAVSKARSPELARTASSPLDSALEYGNFDEESEIGEYSEPADPPYGAVESVRAAAAAIISETPDAKRRSTDSKRRSTDSKRRSRDLTTRSTDSKRRSTESKRRSTDSKRRSTDSKRRSTDSKRRSRDLTTRSTDSKRRSKDFTKISMDNERRSGDISQRPERPAPLSYHGSAASMSLDGGIDELEQEMARLAGEMEELDPRADVTEQLHQQQHSTEAVVPSTEDGGDVELFSPTHGWQRAEEHQAEEPDSARFGQSVATAETPAPPSRPQTAPGLMSGDGFDESLAPTQPVSGAASEGGHDAELEEIRVRAVYDYQGSGQMFGTGDLELSFREGQEFTFVLNMGSGWIRVFDPIHEIAGLVPEAYIERVPVPANPVPAESVSEVTQESFEDAGSVSDLTVSGMQAVGAEERIPTYGSIADPDSAGLGIPEDGLEALMNLGEGFGFTPIGSSVFQPPPYDPAESEFDQPPMVTEGEQMIPAIEIDSRPNTPVFGRLKHSRVAKSVAEAVIESPRRSRELAVSEIDISHLQVSPKIHRKGRGSVTKRRNERVKRKADAVVDPSWTKSDVVQLKKSTVFTMAEAELHSFSKYAREHFSRGAFSTTDHGVVDQSTLHVFSDRKVLRSPLLVGLTSIQAVHHAIDSWSNIQSFMHDKEKDASDVDCLNTILSRGLVKDIPGVSDEQRLMLRDEIYCQVCKQLGSHPEPGHALRGWALLASCCAVFPPTPSFSKVLSSFLFLAKEHKTDHEVHLQLSGRAADLNFCSKVHAWAEYSHNMLRRSLLNGARSCALTKLEMKRIAAMDSRPTRLHVHVGTNHKDHLEVDTLPQIMASQVVAELSKSDSHMAEIFEAEEGERVLRTLEPNEKPGDSVAAAPDFVVVSFKIEASLAKKRRRPQLLGEISSKSSKSLLLLSNPSLRRVPVPKLLSRGAKEAASRDYSSNSFQRISAEHTLKPEEVTDLSDSKMDAAGQISAAVTLQAAIRGHLLRTTLHKSSKLLCTIQVAINILTELDGSWAATVALILKRFDVAGADKKGFAEVLELKKESDKLPSGLSSLQSIQRNHLVPLGADAVDAQQARIAGLGRELRARWTSGSPHVVAFHQVAANYGGIAPKIGRSQSRLPQRKLVLDFVETLLLTFPQRLRKCFESLKETAQSLKSVERSLADEVGSVIPMLGECDSLIQMSLSAALKRGTMRGDATKSRDRIRNSRADASSPFLSVKRRSTRVSKSMSLDSKRIQEAARVQQDDLFRFLSAKQVARVLKVAVSAYRRCRDREGGKFKGMLRHSMVKPVVLQRAIGMALKHELVISFAARLETFEGWPHRSPGAAELAVWGFEYVPLVSEKKEMMDRTRCVQCGLVLFDWEEGDEPGREHNKAESACSFSAKWQALQEPSSASRRKSRQMSGQATPPYARTPSHLFAESEQPDQEPTAFREALEEVDAATWVALVLRLLEFFPEGHDILSSGDPKKATSATIASQSVWKILVDHLRHKDTRTSDPLSVGTIAGALSRGRARRLQEGKEDGTDEFLRLVASSMDTQKNSFEKFERLLFKQSHFQLLLDILDSTPSGRNRNMRLLRRDICENVVSFALADDGLKLRQIRKDQQSGPALKQSGVFRRMSIIKGGNLRASREVFSLKKKHARGAAADLPSDSEGSDSEQSALSFEERNFDPLVTQIIVKCTQRALTQSSRIPRRSFAWIVAESLLARVVVQQSPYIPMLLSPLVAECKKSPEAYVTRTVDLRSTFRSVARNILEAKRSDNRDRVRQLAFKTALELCNRVDFLSNDVVIILGELHGAAAGDGLRVVIIAFFRHCVAPALLQPARWMAETLDVRVRAAMGSVSRAMVTMIDGLPFEDHGAWCEGSSDDDAALGSEGEELPPLPPDDDGERSWSGSEGSAEQASSAEAQDRQTLFDAASRFVEHVLARARKRAPWSIPAPSAKVLKVERRGALLNLIEMSSDPEVLASIRERAAAAAQERMSVLRAVAGSITPVETSFEDVNEALQALTAASKKKERG